jgi:hypothetical protein
VASYLVEFRGEVGEVLGEDFNVRDTVGDGAPEPGDFAAEYGGFGWAECVEPVRAS